MGGLLDQLTALAAVIEVTLWVTGGVLVLVLVRLMVDLVKGDN